MPISPRQQRVFNFIKKYMESNTEPPTIAEIAGYFGYNSPATVHRILVILENEGMIRRTPLVSRGIEIVKQSMSIAV